MNFAPLRGYSIADKNMAQLLGYLSSSLMEHGLQNDGWRKRERRVGGYGGGSRLNIVDISSF